MNEDKKDKREFLITNKTGREDRTTNNGTMTEWRCVTVQGEEKGCQHQATVVY